MKKLTSADSLITINHYKNLLAAEGIPAEIRNEFLGSIVWEIPWVETWPELWIVNDLDFDRATQLITSVESESPTASWRCKKCGEENGGQFAACWKCSTSAD